MSGHSKWATTKHKKAVVDARRGKMFAKLIKNIEVAARMGGGDLAGNPTLYDAIQKAKKSSVPNDNIDRAVKRGLRRRGRRRGRTTRSCTRSTAPGRGVPGRVPDRQPQPRRDGGPHRGHPQRRHDGRPRLGLAPVQPQGRRDRAEGAGGARGRRGRRPRGRARRRRRGRQRPRRVLRGRLRGDRRGRRAQRPPGARRSTTTPPRSQFVASMDIPVDADAAGKVFRLVDALEDLDDVQNVFTNVDVPDDVMAALDA